MPYLKCLLHKDETANYNVSREFATTKFSGLILHPLKTWGNCAEN